MAGLLARAQAKRAIRRSLRDVPETDGLQLGACLKLGPRSAVFAATLDDLDCVVKQARSSGARDLARAQVNELRAQAEAMTSGPFRIPELLVARPDLGLVVMTRAPGQRLDHAIRAEPGRRAEHIGRAGQWLAAYVRDRTQADVFGGGDWIKRRRESIETLPPGEDRERLGALVSRMQAERADIAGRIVTRARSHGDFCAINLLLTETEVWGVDINNANWLALAKDMARFLVYVEIAVPSGRSDGPFGLSDADYTALIGQTGLLSQREAEMAMPYFLASELAGRLVSERRSSDLMRAARALADRMIATPAV